VIANLRNPTLKSRHWEEIEAVLETQFTPEEPLTLGRLVEIDAFYYAEGLEGSRAKRARRLGSNPFSRRFDKPYSPTSGSNVQLNKINRYF